CGLKVSNTLQPKAVITDDVMQGICDVAEEDYDLVIMGATEGGNLRKKLFGNLSEKIFNISPEVSVAVYRARKSKLKVIRDKIEYWCNLTIPQMDREARVNLYENLHVNSNWNFDFISLICLSTAIAALGLISNSTAVVIGAMLVAPLMVPILAAGLAIIQGNMPLVINSAKSIILGFLSALLIGFLVGILTPYDELTSEILARGEPKLADMFIAFFSGVAAAHCMSRPKLSAALPGVAIAAALVPPIASAGIALSLGKTSEATGATVLFFTNVVCIILGSSFTFFAAGVRYNKSRSSNRWVQQAYIGLIVALSLLVIPLSSTLVSKITDKFSASIKLDGREKYRELIQEIINKNPDTGVISLVKIDITDNKKTISVNLLSSKVPDKKLVTDIEKAIEDKLKKKVKIRLLPTIVVE
ncbi:MAG: TIGR00341 family protein, partial [Lentisphaeraceae bacterium]|nr:TIGR00341 family protein [Lentisphaeraceae bacterium]